VGKSVLAVVLLDLYGSDGAAGGIYICGVVQALVGCQQCCQFLQALAFQLLAQLRIHGYLHEIIVSEYTLDIQPRATAEYGDSPARTDIVIRTTEVALEMEDGVLGARLCDINEVIGDMQQLLAVAAPHGYVVVREVLACSDVHTTEYLAAVGADDFGRKTTGHAAGFPLCGKEGRKAGSHGSLAASSWSEKG
jgi:hypothetical protein